IFFFFFETDFGLWKHRASIWAKKDMVSGNVIVDWLEQNVNETKTRDSAIEMAQQMLDYGILRSTKNNKEKFVDSSQELYRFTEMIEEKPLLPAATAAAAAAAAAAEPSMSKNRQSLLLGQNRSWNPNNKISAIMSSSSSSIPRTSSKEKLSSARPSLAHAIGHPVSNTGGQKQQNEAIRNLLTHIIFVEIHTMDYDSARFQEEQLKPLLEEMKTKFVECDKEKRGALNRKEFGEWLEKCGLRLFADDVNTVFTIFDVHGTGFVDYRQFMKSHVPKSVPGVISPTLSDLLKHTITVHFGVESQIFVFFF
ncbi:hypothetical protein RFI_18757, partial [Reticulomyxa filosa]